MGKRILWLLVFMAILALSCGPVSAEESYSRFKDIDQHWAASDIEQCKTFQLISGYPDNLFKPDQNLSRAEALVVIARSLGWENQAAVISTEGIRFPEGLWPGFRGYIALAAEKQLIIKSGIPYTKFNEPASRLEVILWMARALNLTGNGSGLTFSDLRQVPVTYRDMVAGVVGAGIVKGLPGNILNPEGFLTRSEMAAILVRLVEKGMVSPLSGRLVVGKVSKIDPVLKKISVSSINGEQTYELAGALSVYREGIMSDLKEVGAGEIVKLVLNSSGKCVLIAGYKMAGASGEKGYVINKYHDNFTVHTGFDSVIRIPLSGVSLLINGNSTSYGSLNRGSPVELLKSGNTVTAVRILDGVRKVFGKVTEVKAQSVVIKDEDGKSAIYDFRKNTKIKDINGLDTDIAGINVGLNAEILLDDYEYASEIKLYNSTGRELEGKIDEVDVINKRITAIVGGKRSSYYLANSYTINNGGIEASLQDLKKEAGARLTLNTEDRITVIDIIDLSTISGKVVDVNTDGADTITITDKKGQGRTFYLVEGVPVREGSKTLDLDSIEEGMDVILSQDINSRVTAIEITDLSTAVGRVVGIRTTGTRWIIIENDSGRESSYYIDSRAGVTEGSYSHSLDFLKEGMRVKLTLDVRGNVSAVEVLGLQYLAGEITGIQVSGARKVSVKDSSGQVRNYYLDDSVVVREGGRTLHLRDIGGGMHVRLSLDSSGRVISIEVSGSTTVEGEVQYINSSGTAKIEIKKSDGQRETHFMGKSVKVKEGDFSRSLLDIVKGMRVRLTLSENGVVTGLDITGVTTVEGQVVNEGKLTAGGMVALTGNSGQTETYYIDNNVVVREGDSGQDLDYIYEGMRVRLILDGNRCVTRIDILSIYNVSGRVSYIHTADEGVIGILESDGRVKSYNINQKATVWKGSLSRTLGDVREGMNVELNLNRNREVTNINIH